MGRLRVGVVGAVVLLSLLAGCNIIAPLAYYLRPRQIQKPEYEFPPGTRVAMLIEAAQPRYENPVFNQALYERAVELLRAGKSEVQLVPPGAVDGLRRDNPDFPKWSLQKVGRMLGVDQVLYVRIDRLVIRASPDSPLLSPAVDLRTKLIGVHEPALRARLWPQEKDGHPVNCSRQIKAAAIGDTNAADAEARKLGHAAAYYITMPFIEVDLEEKPPVER